VAIKTYLYEILVRGKPDGTLSGAHQILGVVYEDGHERRGEPAPVAFADVATILGKEFTGLAGQLTAANDKIAELEALAAQKDRELLQAKRRLTGIVQESGAAEAS
jgi:hypothetical protein